MNRDIVVVGDLHLVDLEPRTKISRSYKDPRFSIDDAFSSALQSIQTNSKGPLTLVINGDFIDFDLIFLGAQVNETVAKRKLDRVLGDHRTLFEAILRFLAGDETKLVLILGNHDLEFTLRGFRDYFFRRLAELASESGLAGLDLVVIKRRITIEPWFYCEKDVLYVEHGDRFDRYSTSPRPLNMSKNSHSSPPFLSLGSLSNRFILQALPTFNPFMSEQVIHRLRGYLSHLLRHYLIPPYRLPYRYLRGAIRAFCMALRQRKTCLSDSGPDDIEEIVSLFKEAGLRREDILRLWALGKQSVILTSPLRTFRILWLDRVCLFCLFAATFLIVLLYTDSLWLSLGFLPAAALFLWIYERLWGSKEVLEERRLLNRYAEHLCEIIRTPFVVLSHSHRPEEIIFNRGTRYFNCGSWAPIFEDDESTRLWSKGRTYVHLRLRSGSIEAQLVQWTGEGPTSLGAQPSAAPS